MVAKAFQIPTTCNKQYWPATILKQVLTDFNKHMDKANTQIPGIVELVINKKRVRKTLEGACTNLIGRRTTQVMSEFAAMIKDLLKDWDPLALRSNVLAEESRDGRVMAVGSAAVQFIAAKHTDIARALRKYATGRYGNFNTERGLLWVHWKLVFAMGLAVGWNLIVGV